MFSGKRRKNDIYQISESVAGRIAAYEDCLAELPASMKAEMKKATDFKKFNGLACTPTCPGVYTYTYSARGKGMMNYGLRGGVK